MLTLEPATFDPPAKMASLIVVAALVMSYASMSTWAQSLPLPSRTVFKCSGGGKVSYSDSPCLGAEKIDIEPTRGVSKLSGSERIGNDVRREKHRELIAEAIRPVTGMDAKQMDTFGRRMKLTPDSQRECQRLDVQLAEVENREKAVAASSLAEQERELYRMRLRFRELRC
jgi:hypothetical protein